MMNFESLMDGNKDHAYLHLGLCYLPFILLTSLRREVTGAAEKYGYELIVRCDAHML
jgi:hypothetical protein